MISKGKPIKDTTIIYERLSLGQQISALKEALHIDKIPCLIKSPLRPDNKPSFKLFIPRGSEVVLYKDFSTGDNGSVFKLLKELNCPIKEYKEVYVPRNRVKYKICISPREWSDKDASYWLGFGIELNFLEQSNVRPITHYSLGFNTYRCEELAYAFKETVNNVSYYKIYQPLSKDRKWRSEMTSSILSLYNTIPLFGKELIITSSLKDSLCIWSNTGIPCINPQGEGYSISTDIMSDLKQRFDNIYVLYDNDKAGKENGLRISKENKITYLELPKGPKDPSDLYKSLNNKQEFINIIKQVISNGKKSFNHSSRSESNS